MDLNFPFVLNLCLSLGEMTTYGDRDSFKYIQSVITKALNKLFSDFSTFFKTLFVWKTFVKDVMVLTCLWYVLCSCHCMGDIFHSEKPVLQSRTIVLKQRL